MNTQQKIKEIQNWVAKHGNIVLDKKIKLKETVHSIEFIEELGTEDVTVGVHDLDIGEYDNDYVEYENIKDEKIKEIYNYFLKEKELCKSEIN